MSYKLKNQKKATDDKITLELEISNNHLRKSLNSAYRDISENAKIPGFRKGKVPFNIIDINYGRDYVLNEAARISISDLYPKIIDDTKIKPIDYPKVDIKKIGQDIPLEIEITVQVEPEITLPAYKNIEVTGISEEVTEEEVDKQVNNLRNNYAVLEPVEDDRAVEKGDFVIIDFEGTIEGKEFEGNNAQDYTLEVGSNTLFEDFEKAIIGIKKGGKKEATLNLPEGIANKELAGKAADFSITVKEIKRKALPEIDENFLKNFGEYQSVEEFRSFISGRIKEQKTKIRRDRIISDIMDNLVNNLKTVVPEVMVSNRLNHYKEELEADLKEHKISRSDYLKAYNISEEDFNKNLNQSALKEVKEYLIINALEKAEQANIEPGQQQLEEEAEKVLANTQKEEEKNKLKNYLESPEGKEDLKESVKRRNLFDLLIKNARIKEEKIPNPGKNSAKKILTPAEAEKEDSANQSGPAKELWVPGSKK